MFNELIKNFIHRLMKPINTVPLLVITLALSFQSFQAVKTKNNANGIRYTVVDSNSNPPKITTYCSTGGCLGYPAAKTEDNSNDIRYKVFVHSLQAAKTEKNADALSFTVVKGPKITVSDRYGMIGNRRSYRKVNYVPSVKHNFDFQSFQAAKTENNANDTRYTVVVHSLPKRPSTCTNMYRYRMRDTRNDKINASTYRKIGYVPSIKHNFELEEFGAGPGFAIFTSCLSILISSCLISRKIFS